MKTTALAVAILSFAIACSSSPRGDGGEHPRVEEHLAMVAKQIEARGVTNEAVLAAMRRTPRHLFIPKAGRGMAYEDHPVSIGWRQTISQPYIVGLMTDLLDVRPGTKVLEIGTGSGYQAAVLAELGASVYTIEILEPLGLRAEKALRELGYENVFVRIGDGYAGWPEHAPFDRIIVTCAPEEIPAALKSQLADGGIMVLPVGPTGGIQELVVVRRRGDEFLRDAIIPVVFVPMVRGEEK